MTSTSIEYRRLAIVERAYRGAVETQFYDTFYCAAMFHQRGGLDVLLRGHAVTYAVPAPPLPPLRIGDRSLTTVSDPRTALGALLDAGAQVWVEEPDLLAHGFDRDTALLPGVRIAADGEMAVRWLDYGDVFYL